VNTDVLLGLLDDARDPLLALDDAGVILHANEAAAARFGRARRFLVGKPFATLIAVSDRRRFRKALAEVEINGSRLDLALETGLATVALRRLPGVAPPVVTVAIPVDPSAPVPHEPTADVTSALDRFFLRFPLGVVGIRADGRVAFVNPRARQLLGGGAVQIGHPLGGPPALTELVRQLVAIPTGVHGVEIEVADGRSLRAIGLGSRQDEPAVVMLEDATAERRRDRVMHEFLRNAAHQIRTPLTGIATAVEVLQAGAKNEPAERDRFLTHVETHAARLTRIARGLLVLARAQSGGTMRLEFVELEPLLVELAELAAPAEGVTLTVECPSRLAALAEVDLAHEALAALVENAVRHTKEGSITLRAAEHNGHVEIEVSDTGSGILSEHRERVFEPFYRPTADGHGFGLGLAIASQAVQAMGGELLAADAELGSTFVIRLPSARVLP
jgi:signal transduction histidine kinase